MGKRGSGGGRVNSSPRTLHCARRLHLAVERRSLLTAQARRRPRLPLLCHSATKLLSATTGAAATSFESPAEDGHRGSRADERGDGGGRPAAEGGLGESGKVV
jgi:hypothetical protein